MSDDTQVMSTTDRLVYMAHQIARNFATLGEDGAVEAVASHLSSYWDPRMKAHIIAIARDQPERLSPVVTGAVARIARHAPDAQ
ncbi:MAG TPA: formate dehydrogenase subunit delta [Sphingobium sp.]|nr:formate dehydrogenase subunit delta [Sphingobium sp.]